jgi:hypothetical protein
MKKLVLLLLSMAITLVAGGFFTQVHAQDPTKDDKPTFYRLIPGVYVNPWPRFSITYPKDWVEHPPSLRFKEVFSVWSPAPVQPSSLHVTIHVARFTLDKFADKLVTWFKDVGFTKVTVKSDKPSKLRDGTPAREVETKIAHDGQAVNIMYLATIKDHLLIYASVTTQSGKVGKDLKAIAYSLEFQPGKEERVKLPPDVQEFLDRNCSAHVAFNVEQLMTYYSDRYLNSGRRKGEMEKINRDMIVRIKSCDIGITEFVSEGDRAYLAGFITGSWGREMLQETSIIKENGEWKRYGNQRDVVPQ